MSVKKGYKAYVCSFCENGDYLPAWRYYGGDGAGFSIGFKKNYFKPLQYASIREATVIYKISYEKQDIIDFIK